MKKIVSAVLTVLLAITITIHNGGIVVAEGTPPPVPILLYHHISLEENHGGISEANMSAREFREHMVTLKEKGYNPIPLKQYYDYVLDPNVVLPTNPIVITFDDGYLSNYEVAFPILRDMNIPATIFVVTDSRGKVKGEGVNLPHFTWEQAREMEGSGLIDIQSHSNTHANLIKISDAEIQHEIRLSKYLIETNLNKTVDCLAYPFGDFNEQALKLAKAAGYKMHVMVGNKTIGEFSANLRTDGLDAIRRLTVSGGMSGADLVNMIESSKAERQ